MSKGKFIKGTNGDDRLTGTSKNDFIISGKGKDEINAGAGHDIILSGKGNDIVTGGSGDDCIHLGKGNDTAIYVLEDNVDNKDFYHGGRGHDTLRLEFTKEEWLRPDIQADIAAYLAYLSGNTVPDGYWYNRSTFEFKAFNLTAKQFENLEVVVDGKLLNPADELVDAVDDVVTVSENGTITGNVLDNDDVPDLVKSVELIDDVTKGSLNFNIDGTFIYDTNGEFEDLAVGETATQTFTYKVIDADGDEDVAMATITITGENDAPVASMIDAGITNEDASTVMIDLLSTASDVDSSDDLDTDSVMVSSSNVGRTVLFLIDNETGVFSLEPSQFNELAVGESEMLTISYNVIDGNGGVTPNTATLLVEGRNDAPIITVTNPDPVLEGNFDRFNQTATDIQTVDVFAQTNIDDPDTSDTQNFVQGSISILADSASATMDLGLLTIDQTTGEVSYDRNKFNFLDDGESAIYNVTYQVKSGPETFTETLVITILGENDAPFVRRPLLDPIDEDTPLIITKADLLSSTVEFDLNDQGNLELVDVELNGASAPYGSLFDNGDDTWTFTPSENFFTDQISSNFHIRVNFKVSDGTAAPVQSDAQFRILPVNDAPTVMGTLEKSAPEDGATTTLDLLSGASDVENDTLTIANLTSPLPAGILLSGSILTIDPTDASFQHLAVGDSEIINLSYDIEDGNGGSVPQTAKITITGTNDAPMVTQAIVVGTNEDESFTVNLLAGASDPDDGETATLSVVNLSPLPLGFSFSDNSLIVDLTHAAFQQLAEGVHELITVTYDIEDIQGGTVAQTATISVIGTNDAPMVASLIERAVNEDEQTLTIDLLEGATDVDDGETATLSVTNVSPLPFGLMLFDNAIVVDPSHTAFQHLAEGVDEVITVNYEIEDEQGAKVAQTAKITITGQNDLPEVGAIIEKSANEDDDNFIVDLLEGASDPDDGETQTLSVASLAGLEAGLVQSGNTVTVDPSDGAFQSLAKDEPYIITLSYDIVDAQGDSTPQTAKITIIGKNDTPEIQSPVTSNSTEDGVSQTVDLLPTGAITDIDEGDVLSVVAGTLSQTGGRMLSSAQLSGNNLTYNPNEFNDLGGAESESLTFTYDVTDSKGGTVTQTLNLTINGENDAPVTTPIDAGQVSEDDAPFIINLLAGQTDPDTTDSLSIENIVAEDNFGNPVTLMNNNDGTITLDPNQYDALNDGENRIVTVTYDVADGTTTTQNTASLEVIGATDNLPPMRWMMC